LGRGKQDETLQDYCSRFYPEAKTDLATCIVERCLRLCSPGGTTAVVSPQNWLFLASYKALREKLLGTVSFCCVVRLGAKAFQTPMWDFNVALVSMSRQHPRADARLAGIDVADADAAGAKAVEIRRKEVALVAQHLQLKNPGSKVMLDAAEGVNLLASRAQSFQGIKTGDDGRVCRAFWELPAVPQRWRFYQSTVEATRHYGGLEGIIDWADNGEGLARRQGMSAWGKRGVMVSQMGHLPVSLYLGEAFDSNASPIIPNSETDILALWALCASGDYAGAVRKVDQSLKPTNTSLVQVPFELGRWQQVASSEYPQGLPRPSSADPTQWLFDGQPNRAAHVLQVTVARLLGYRWPRQTGSRFHDCAALAADVLEEYADADGIVCLAPLNREKSAAQRLRTILTKAIAGADEQSILNSDGATRGKVASLEEWLSNDFFEQHCNLFQQRPFVLHIWDGRKDGFHALVNYHKLDHANLQKLTYAYLGDWIRQQEE
jgi:hypothetical protein